MKNNASLKTCARLEAHKNVEETEHRNVVHTGHSLYPTYLAMRRRCMSPYHSSYKNYGARGITICDSWAKRVTGFENFLRDMGDRPSDKHTVDRINVNLGYSKENCRWATPHEQVSNRRNNNEVVGVFWFERDSFWIAKLQINGKIYRKTFKEKSDAIAYRKALEVKYLGYELNK